MEISSDDRIDEPVTEENIQAQPVGTENTPIVIKQPVNVRYDFKILIFRYFNLENSYSL